MPERIGVTVNGRKISVGPETSVAVAVVLAEECRFRVSPTGEPRGPLCGMGICFECRATVDGRSNCRTCQIVVREGMVVQTS